MRKVIVINSMSLDGVMQAPGGPEEDESGAFQHGGWAVPYFDETVGEAIGISYGQPYDLLLGRRTYDIFAAHWPRVAADPSLANAPEEIEIARRFDASTKFVATHRAESLNWKNSEALGSDIAARVREIRNTGHQNLLVVGSAALGHLLFAADLVDELHLHIAPILLGHGKRLFDAKTVPRALQLSRSAVAKTGMIVANYTRDGEIRTGSFALPAE